MTICGYMATKCKPDFLFNWDKCSCLLTKKCRKRCARGQQLHPDYECSCVKKAVVKELTVARKAERELEEGLRCRERHCVDPIRFKWNSQKCYCELHKACP